MKNIIAASRYRSDASLHTATAVARHRTRKGSCTMLAINRTQGQLRAWLGALTLAALSTSAAVGQGLLPHSNAAPQATEIQGHYEETSTVTSVNPPAPGACSNTSLCNVLFSPIPA